MVYKYGRDTTVPGLQVRAEAVDIRCSDAVSALDWRGRALRRSCGFVGQGAIVAGVVWDHVHGSDAASFELGTRSGYLGGSPGDVYLWCTVSRTHRKWTRFTPHTRTHMRRLTVALQRASQIVAPSASVGNPGQEVQGSRQISGDMVHDETEYDRTLVVQGFL